LVELLIAVFDPTPLLREVEERGGERRCVMIFANPSLRLHCC
jgi:hypothetical protein